MSKVAILTDSNSGITQAQSKDMGVTVIPMPFFIDGVEYLEDINLTQEEFYEKLKNDADISTSQPSIGTLQDYFDELLKDNDEVVFIPMSSSIRGTDLCKEGRYRSRAGISGDPRWISRFYSYGCKGSGR